MIQKFLNQVLQVFDFCAVYYVVQLAKCVLFSLAASVVVLTLRKTLLKNNAFFKGALWSLFIPVLFVGKLKFFDESETGVKLFWWLREILVNHTWICWLYLCSALLFALMLIRRTRKLKRFVAGLEIRKVEDTLVYVTDIPVTPSTIGIFRPKIVVPEIMLREYSREEIQMILLHEKTHIRLGHLLIYSLWNILRVLLWPNLLLIPGTKYLREDMEEICDLVTIRKSREEAYTYGQLLLRSMKILQAEGEDFNMYANFAGDKEYRNIRQRILRIAGYRPYKQIKAVSTMAVMVLCVVSAVIGIRSISYGRNIDNDNILVYGYEDGNVTFFDNSAELCRMITYDDDYVYVQREDFELFLQDRNARGEIFLVFGGFVKLPGIGGLGFSCEYRNDTEEKIVQIPYENYEDDWLIKFYKLL